MSNLIKSVYFNMDQGRVIDSNRQMEAFVPQLFRQEPETENELEAQELSQDFQTGLSVLNMEDVRREEREKVVQETSVEVEELLAQAKEEASRILQQAQQEAENIREQAFEEGKQQGMEEGRVLAQQQLLEERKQIEHQMQLREQQLKEQELALEPQFAEIMGALIEKITGVVCQDKKEIIVYLIHQALNQLERTKHVTLRVSKEDMLLVSGCRQELKECLAQGTEFDVLEDESLEAFQCIIETDNKMIDCSLDTQLSNLKDQIRMLTIM